MKALPVIPPAAALIASGLWIGLQRQSTATLREETVILRERIAAARDADERPVDGATAAASDRKPPRKSFDNMSWEEMAAMMEKMHRGSSGDHMRQAMALQRHLMEMDVDEL